MASSNYFDYPPYFFPPSPPQIPYQPSHSTTPPPPPGVKPPSHSTPPPPPPGAKPPSHSTTPPPPPGVKPPSYSTPPPPPPGAKPPSHSTPPPPPPAAKPPSSHPTPPPPPAAKPPSHSTPPPPHQPFRPPPPPHVLPPPPPSPPSPSPDNNPTVIVIVFISLGSAFFLACLAVALCCFIKKRKKKTLVQETDIIHVDEHRTIKEAIVEGPHGPQAVILSVEDDVHVDEEIRKNTTTERFGHGGFHAAKGVESNNIPSTLSKSSNIDQESEIIHVDGHRKVKENLVEGPHGEKAVVLTIEDDVHIDEVIRKNEERYDKGLHAPCTSTSSDHHHHVLHKGT